MITYIGSNKCSRCGGNDPNCYVCHEPEKEPEEEETLDHEE